MEYLVNRWYNVEWSNLGGKSSPEFDWEEIKRFRENVGVYAKKEGEQG